MYLLFLQILDVYSKAIDLNKAAPAVLMVNLSIDIIVTNAQLIVSLQS